MSRHDDFLGVIAGLLCAPSVLRTPPTPRRLVVVPVQKPGPIGVDVADYANGGLP